VRQHLQERVQLDLMPAVQDLVVSIDETSTEILRLTYNMWTDHCICMRMISDILMYLDRVYSKDAHVPLIYDAGLAIFRDAVIRHESLGPLIYKKILSEIHKDRAGQVIDRIALKHIIYMLEFLPVSNLDGDSIYFAEFEPMVCKATSEYYDKAAEDLLTESQNGAIYIKQTAQWLQAEEERCNLYLSIQSLPRLLDAVKAMLITKRFKTVMEFRTNGLRTWIENDQYSEIKLLYDLASLVTDTHDDTRSLLNSIIIEKGTEINNKINDSLAAIKAAKASGIKNKGDGLNPTSVAIQWVEDVLALKDKYDMILTKCYNGSTGIREAVESSFSQFVNKVPKVSEYLSLFVDDNMKKSLKGKSDTEIEEVLDKAVILFRFISDKDLFETYYKAHFAKRLLNGRSLSDDIERSMIAKLKMEIGTSFTSKLEGMFRDMKISKDIMVEYKALEKKPGGIDMSVNILTSSVWPMTLVTSASKVIYPTEVETARKAFEEFYLTRHNGRKLEWNNSMGTVDVRARYKNKTHEINMPTYAMIILILFNDVEDGESLTFEQIKEATNIPEADLMRHLQSLAVAPRTRLLRKEPMSKNISPGDRFSVNNNFESPMTRLKVLAVTSSNRAETEVEKKETMEKVDASRKHEADATIVRIMKARKTLDHPNLMVEVTTQLSARFKPAPSFIKQRIEDLINREYLRRDDEKRTLYHYVVSIAGLFNRLFWDPFY